ncbi:hypothetical protein TPA0910_23910 [Streptomyces hygroscopicus subsp. sporocinereus]|uniref:Uncharacterized protein n=1 Tax=Streptomyces hygroscopicus TaxID=1912 RepID=A0ABQ3TXF7_STRHY|nr:hypothetical protein TPA0910_23910 [Streptomyces hygroscopicus]
MRTSMAILKLLSEDGVEDGGSRMVRGAVTGCGHGVVKCARAPSTGAPRWRRAGSGGRGGGRTHRAGEPAQVDVEPRHEQHARRLVAHTIENHGLIVSIPERPPGRLSRYTDR